MRGRIWKFSHGLHLDRFILLELANPSPAGFANRRGSMWLAETKAGNSTLTGMAEAKNDR